MEKIVEKNAEQDRLLASLLTRTEKIEAGMDRHRDDHKWFNRSVLGLLVAILLSLLGYIWMESRKPVLLPPSNTVSGS